MDPTEPGRFPALPVAYASFGARLRALIIDSLVFAAALVTFLVASELVPDSRNSGRMLLAVLVLFALLYEPVLVSHSGATLGHRAANLRVVADDSGGNPGFGRALARFIIKSFLELPSFIAMALTRRHQAVHDSLTKTTVQIHDLGRARPGDLEFEREEEPGTPMPSRWRRAGVILAYSAGVFLLVSLVTGLLLSPECLDDVRCTPGENIVANVTSLAWVAATVYFIVAGWRGRLRGARRSAEPAPSAAARIGDG
jgi:uncharacterized RDD family membrane protein YckC